MTGGLLFEITPAKRRKLLHHGTGMLGGGERYPAFQCDLVRTHFMGPWLAHLPGSDEG